MKKIIFKMILLSLISVLFSSQTLNVINSEIEDNCWVNMNPENHPPAERYKLIYDSESDVVICNYNNNGEKMVYYYIFDNNTCNSRHSPNMPSHIDSMDSRVYDPKNDVIIFFGSMLYDQNWDGFHETWSYDFNTDTWTNLTTASHPPKRFITNIVYDSQSEKIVIFGGVSNYFEPNIYYQDVWTYDYALNTWTNVTPAFNPESYYVSSAVYDSKAGRILLFGGQSKDVTYDNKTWAFDLETTTWENREAANPPPYRSHSAMVYDSFNDKTILFGGIYLPYGDIPGYQSRSDTWCYDYTENKWTELNCTIHPYPRWTVDFAYNSKEHKAMIFGGTYIFPNYYKSDTWVFACNESCGCLTTTELANIDLITVSMILFLATNIIIIRRKKKH
ncbi:MAG: hypothetical protein FK731_02155 [Asgard group archaeon]|nr:hypothetical protein [Asgard group archaeon]